MNRRSFVITGLAAFATPSLVLAAPVAYTDGLAKTHLAKGEVVFLDFKADWCGTCKAQERVINALKGENPDYEAKVTFINVDWDAHGKGALVKELNIPRRSTLVVLKGEEELGRIVAGTGKDEIKALMDVALAAAASS
ncbi:MULTISPECIES: thioredoxin family protein [Lentibacter]|jgi:thioredoxin 1|uniref:Thioredoxin n=1 Tax=Lentibacter algarum TaxID=576131 RepID=A0A1H3MCC1_9RHOB|nr:thioredoxin family protein [Lentibacter algarum]MCO4777908.1 thioredoxin family protein [Lentibacter algarum]MCO4828645.1 thioredoxin family protein [Lentibacter algarum]WIF33046.1 Thioredoxin [Lentibacter algarum]SDY74370.1 Thioredoxin [Lentibacter algarum]